jgi:hypothetical protein
MRPLALLLFSSQGGLVLGMVATAHGVAHRAFIASTASLRHSLVSADAERLNSTPLGPLRQSLLPRMQVEEDDDGAALSAGWKRGSGASSLRPLVERLASSPRARAAAAAVASSTAGWSGLWVARIEHFEKVAITGLRVRPHYALDDDGRIVSHVHLTIGPISGWASAAGVMRPSANDASSVTLVFDDFWVGADAPAPRETPPEAGASAFDALTRAIGRALFFEGLADFPIDYADMNRGIVSFRFTAFNSCIVAQRAPEGEAPQRVGS